MGRTFRGIDGGGGLPGQGLRFAVVGSLATVLQLGLYAFLSGSIGAQLANFCAWLISTMVATAGHQRYTFGVARDEAGGRPSSPAGRVSGVRRRHPLVGRSAESNQVAGLLTSLAGLGLSSVVLAVMAQPTGLTGTLALVGVNSVVGALRFLVLRWWLVSRGNRRPSGDVESGNSAQRLVGRGTHRRSSDMESGHSALQTRDVPDLMTPEGRAVW